VAQAIKDEISIVIQREVEDPHLGFVTITRVEVSPDLHYAKIFFSAIGSEEVKKDSMVVLKRMSGFLRRELSHRLSMRYVPQLQFYFDIAIEHGDKIQRLLNQLEEEAKLNPSQTGHESRVARPEAKGEI